MATSEPFGQTGDAPARLDVRVRGLDCESDANRIQRGLAGFPGLSETKVNPGAARVTLLYDPAVTTSDVLRDKLDDLGFTPQGGMEVAGPPKPATRILSTALTVDPSDPMREQESQ